MLNFDIPRCSRICASTRRELKPGEWFFSVLFEDNKGNVKRLDYSQDGWEGAPSDKDVELIGYWKSRLAGQNDNKLKLAPNDILLNLFDQISDQLDKREMRYVLALLLIRRRILRLEKEETAEDGRKNMILYYPKRETNYLVTIVQPSDKQIEEMQNTLISLLYAG
ncbi:MAG: hypothetical protein LBT05_16600 [Planctomycetaceae bacterium]|jgi:hypothetical protein|nr:hypothetical protein [Planctomycetaceae bacterium]